MKNIGFVFLFMISCLSFANDNNYIFIGKNNDEQAEKTVFVLQLMSENFENYVHISDAGEVYLKVDKIVVMQQKKVDCSSNLITDEWVLPAEMGDSGSIIQASVFRDSLAEEIDLYCPNCKRYYTAKRWNRTCPRCGKTN